MKNEMKLNNKGFSLVELIVVIAIMAILVGVLAPSVLGQLDKAKVAKDKQTLDSIATAVSIAWADPDVADKPAASAGVVDITTSVGINCVKASGFVSTNTSGTTFKEVCQQTVGYTNVMFESNKFSAVSALKIEVNAVTGKITVSALDGSSTAVETITK